jgi:hypothetical protein
MEVFVPPLNEAGYRTFEWRHATSVLKSAFPDQWSDLVTILSSFRLKASHIQREGGRKSPVVEELESQFFARGWSSKNWDTQIEVTETRKGKAVGDPIRMLSPTHEIDHVKGRIALEIEWSNKDPFFDRDLNNFRLLFDLRVISVGVILTKDESLLGLFRSLPDLGKTGMQKYDRQGRPVMCSIKFGTSTTWLNKLLPRIEGGGGGGCPIFVLAMTEKLFEVDQ